MFDSIQKLATLKRILGKAETPPADESDSPSNSLENHENDLESRDKLKLDRKSKRRPILIKDDSFDIISSTLLTDAADSVAVDWMSFRNIKQCVCDYPFEHFSRKVRK